MKYYLGLDMGTDSVGWAVTDEHYNIVRAKGKIFGEFGNLKKQRQPLIEECREPADEGLREKRPG